MDERIKWWWIAGLLAIYLLLSAVLPAADDEVYYWCWSKDLQWSYFDHPPMTAVLIRLSTTLFGDSVFGYRVPACLASAFVVYVISRLTPASPLILGIILSPLFTYGAVLITPDSPLLFCWTAYVWWLIELHRRLAPHPAEDERIQPATVAAATPVRSANTASAPGSAAINTTIELQWWLLGGVILGCGVLSKYTMALAVPTAFASLLLARRPWKLWLPGYVFHGIVSFLVALPILIYNMAQNFEPLLFQLQHSAQKSPNSWMTLGDFVGVQILLFGTLPFFLLPWAYYNFRRLSQCPRLRVCFCLYALPLTYFIYKSTQARLEGNWGLICFIAFWPVAGAWYATVRQSRFWRSSTAMAFLPPLLCVTFLTVHLISPISLVPVRGDRIYRQIAINNATREVARQVRELGEILPVYTTSYQLTALLRFQLLDARQIEGASRPSHFTRPPRHLTDVDCAYFIDGQPLPEKFSEGFGIPELVTSVPIEFRGVVDNTLYVWRYAKVADNPKPIKPMQTRAEPSASEPITSPTP